MSHFREGLTTIIIIIIIILDLKFSHLYLLFVQRYLLLLTQFARFNELITRLGGSLNLKKSAESDLSFPKNMVDLIVLFN